MVTCQGHIEKAIFYFNVAVFVFTKKNCVKKTYVFHTQISALRRKFHIILTSFYNENLHTFIGPPNASLPTVGQLNLGDYVSGKLAPVP